MVGRQTEKSSAKSDTGYSPVACIRATRSEARFDAIIENVGDGILAYGHDRSALRVNQKARELLQLSSGDVAVEVIVTTHPELRMAPRQRTGFVESLLRLVGLAGTVPDFGTLCRRQKTLAVNIPYRGSKGPLHLLIESTGIKVEGEGEWHARKHGGPKRRI